MRVGRLMARRACDRCVKRKVKCDGHQPCQTCVLGQLYLHCTYLTPARKRGPKNGMGRRGSKDRPEIGLQQTCSPYKEIEEEHINDEHVNSQHMEPQHFQNEGVSDTTTPSSSRTSPFATGANHIAINTPDTTASSSDPPPCRHSSELSRSSTRVPRHALNTIVEVYRLQMYPVWPVVHIDVLLKHLQEPKIDLDIYILATSLCAATMVQLNLSPIDDGGLLTANQDMERECSRARGSRNYRERPNTNHVLSSFFLHVYHAKLDNQNSAILYLQEAISLARLLKLDDGSLPSADGLEPLTDARILYLLLWVSERGYAIQHALPISLPNSISLSSISLDEGNVHVKGLINLAALFVTFDSSSIPQFSRYGKFPTSAEGLVKIEETIADAVVPSAQFDSVQRADFLVTKQWMRILLWQQAMARGLLSFVSPNKSMTFFFPARVTRDLLKWMKLFPTDNLMPLGRDQLIKLFEIANTLADVILCNPQVSYNRGYLQLGPSDFLHGLYQTMLPLLELDPPCSFMLREKAAEALLRAPNRALALLTNNLPEDDEDTEEEEDLDIYY